MALANNHRDQLAKRLKADILLREPSWAIVQSTSAAGDPLLLISSGGTNLALCQIARRSFNGFNVVAELSSSAAEGLPEHIAYMLVDTAASQANATKLAMMVKMLGTSSVQMGFVANGSLTEANLTAGNVSYEMGNDARNGAVGA
jgi:hypothetical protein